MSKTQPTSLEWKKSPITLLNNDCKILALIFANRLKDMLHSVIDESQTGFKRKRHIANNIGLFWIY